MPSSLTVRVPVLYLCGAPQGTPAIRAACAWKDVAVFFKKNFERSAMVTFIPQSDPEGHNIPTRQ